MYEVKGEKEVSDDMEQKKVELKASLHVKKGQPLPDCPFRLKVTGKTDVDVIIGDEAVTKKVQKKDNHSLPV